MTLAEPVRVQWLLASPAKPEAVQWEQLLSRSDHYLSLIHILTAFPPASAEHRPEHVPAQNGRASR